MSILHLSPAWFLFAGILVSVAGFPKALETKAKLKKWGAWVLQISIVLLGAKIPIGELLEASVGGLATTSISVALVFLAGYLLNKVLKVEQDQAILISGGTAICGGSAIGAIAPTIKAKNIDIGVSISIVFLLNAVAMVLFPVLGRAFHLTDQQFGYFAALAIHDTSSVVGAGSQWNEAALRLATTIKLSRTLWIFPVVLIFSFMTYKKAKTNAVAGAKKAKVPVPWFIAGFLLMSLFYTYVLLPNQSPIPAYLVQLSTLGFCMSLLLIGLSLSRDQLFKVGYLPLLFGVILWFTTIVGSLVFVKTCL